MAQNDTVQECARRLRHLALLNDNHADQIAASPLGYLWHILRWRKAKRLYELRFIATELRLAAEVLDDCARTEADS